MKTADTPVAARATGHVDLTIMLAMHDAFRRDLAHLAGLPPDLAAPIRPSRPLGAVGPVREIMTG